MVKVSRGVSSPDAAGTPDRASRVSLKMKMYDTALCRVEGVRNQDSGWSMGLGEPLSFLRKSAAEQAIATASLTDNAKHRTAQ